MKQSANQQAFLACPLRDSIDESGKRMIEDDNGLDYLPEDTLGDQWRRNSMALWETLLADASFSAASLHDRIAQLAYQFYLRRGRVVGHDLDDWFIAERIVLSRLAQAKNQPGDQLDGKKE